MYITAQYAHIDRSINCYSIYSTAYYASDSYSSLGAKQQAWNTDVLILQHFYLASLSNAADSDTSQNFVKAVCAVNLNGV